MIINLQFASVHIFPNDNVCTFFPDGIFCYGSREVNDQNIREARSQGYKGNDSLAVWRSLVEHELLHSLVAECIFDRPSLVLRTEGGGEFHPSWLRYEEEMLAISWQAFTNGLGYGPLDRYDLRDLPSKWASISIALEPLCGLCKKQADAIMPQPHADNRNLKWSIWPRTNGSLISQRKVRCHWCSRWMTYREASVDHDPPKAFGGTDNEIVLACVKCNNERSKVDSALCEIYRFLLKNAQNSWYSFLLTDFDLRRFYAKYNQLVGIITRSHK